MNRAQVDMLVTLTRIHAPVVTHRERTWLPRPNAVDPVVRAGRTEVVELRHCRTCGHDVALDANDDCPTMAALRGTYVDEVVS